MRTLTIALLMLTSPPGLALAQTAPGATCSIRSTGINFGLYSALDQGPNTARGRIEVVCDPPAATSGLRVTLSPGRSAQPMDRTMAAGEGVLRYNLFADPGHHRVLGDGSNGTVPLIQLTRGLGRATFRVYAKIWPRQSIPAGEYTDNVRIVVEF